MIRLLKRTVCVGSLLVGLSGGQLMGGTKPPPRDDINTTPPAVGEKLPGHEGADPLGVPSDPLKSLESDQGIATPGTAAPDGTTTPGDALAPGADLKPEKATPLHDAPKSKAPGEDATKSDAKSGDAALGSEKKDAGGIPLSHQDVQFIQRAAEYHVGNMILGFLTIQRAENDDLKKHGNKLVDDSVKANRKLMELAETKDVFIPLDQLKLPKEAMSDLAEKKGKEFDSAFIAVLLNEGTLMQGDLQSALSNVRDPAVRDHAQQFLSGLMSELNSARDLAKTLGAEVVPVGEPPLPEKDDKEKNGTLMPGETPQDLPSTSPEGGENLRPFDNPPGI